MKNINEEDLNKMIRAGLQKAFQGNSSSLPQTGDATTDNFVSMGQMINAIESELEEETGYSQFLKSKDNPKGETEGLTVDTLNKILMKIVNDFSDEDVEKVEATEVTGAGSSGSFSAPLFTEPKKNNLFQPGTETKLETKPEGGPVNEVELRDFEKGEYVRLLKKAAAGPNPMKNIRKILDDLERKLTNNRATGIKYVHGVRVEEQEEEEVMSGDTEDMNFDFFKGEYEPDSKSYVGAYLVGEETPKQLAVYNIIERPDRDSFYMSGHVPYSISLKKSMLPVSQIEVLGDVPGKEGFKFIRMPYWFFKKNQNDLKISRLNEKKSLYMKGYDRKEENMDKLFDPMFEKYFEAIVYDDIDQQKYDIAKSNYRKFKKPMNEEKIKGGLADKMGLEDIAIMHDVDMDTMFEQLRNGVTTEMEHTSEMMVAMEIAMDHLYEDPYYYEKLTKMEGGETTEVTSASSAGAYDVPFGFPKRDPLKLDNPDTVEKKTRPYTDKNFPKYGGPGAKLVKIKKKCSKFPYCNQGDINALEIFEKEIVKEMVTNTAKRTNLKEYVVRNIIAKELGYIQEQEDGEEFATISIPDKAFKSNEDYRKEFLDAIPDKRARFLIDKFEGKEFDFEGNGLSGKVKIMGIGPVGNVGFFSQSEKYVFDKPDVEIHAELMDLNFRGQKVPIDFYNMISRYLPPEEEEDSYRGNPVEDIVSYGIKELVNSLKYLSLRLDKITINPYGRFSA
jgi:hypothetical protein